MTVAALQERINREVANAIVPALLEAANYAHRKHWRECDCQWCALKRRATHQIGEVRCGDRERRADLRFQMANDFRKALADAFLNAPEI